MNTEAASCVLVPIGFLHANVACAPPPEACGGDWRSWDTNAVFKFLPLCPFLLCRQYHYVLQSLMLWREVSNDMFKLWYLAETDMLRQGTQYRLCDTGQGLNRVQVGGEEGVRGI